MKFLHSLGQIFFLENSDIDIAIYANNNTLSLREKYGVFTGPYFPAFSPNTGKYGPEKTPYFDTFLAVRMPVL